MTELGERRIEAIMETCERSEDLLHKRLAVILNDLHDDYNVSVEIIEEIENLYIVKGDIYCRTGYRQGFKDASRKRRDVNTLTEC
ncbi:oxidoreductase [Paenibacillus sp. EKM211P]|uniref:oxidoreductase n=1 Tax=Paenibacillus sp. EKM211P TaxID=1683679 RepID=UPI00162AD3BB|nr:oxidoreductase [Paenibacillus sp. EKM211P]KAF6585029.1 oxidoreductase [Paenibacillus sp. EKM211P]